MKILFTGGGTGGHFYPIIAVAKEIRRVAKENKMVQPTLLYFAPDPYIEQMLYDNQISFSRVSSGKVRAYSSILNFFDMFKTFFGVIGALWKVFWSYPDVIFSKGGYGSFPVVFAGRMLGIPIIIHESDSVPGKVNRWAGKFAKRIAISYPDAAAYFPKDKTAWTGNPVRPEIEMASKEGAKEFLNLKENIPTLLILGGSQGAKLINDIILDALPKLIEKFQIIHQTGINNFKEVNNTAKSILIHSDYKDRYMAFQYLDDLAMKMSAGAADLIITRAGSAIFEIASWGIPSIIIPITESNGNHQRLNAYTYARTGAGIVIEEKNLSDDILMAQISKIMDNDAVYQQMAESSKNFAKPNADREIAEEIIRFGLHN